MREAVTASYGPSPSNLEQFFRNLETEPWNNDESDAITNSEDARKHRKREVYLNKRTRVCPGYCKSYQPCTCEMKDVLAFSDNVTSTFRGVHEMVTRYLRDRAVDDIRSERALQELRKIEHNTSSNLRQCPTEYLQGAVTKVRQWWLACKVQLPVTDTGERDLEFCRSQQEY